MYSPGVQAFVILVVAGLIGLAVLAALPALITGLICGAKMPGLSLGCGLRYGLLLGAAEGVIVVENLLLGLGPLTYLIGTPAFVGSMVLTWWLCRRESRRSLALR